jgi:hypothetical protein
MPSETLYRSRRHFLKGGLSLLIVGGLSVTTRPTAALAAGIPAGGDKGQTDWRFCNKCNGLFYDGYPQKGRCPADGGHVAQGFNFVLPFNTPAAPDTQTAWRFCNKCNGMFYDGYSQKGRCPAGGGHVAQGYNFVLSHPGDRPRGSQGPTTPPAVIYCTDTCSACTRDGLQCSLNNNCSFSNARAPYACYR